LANRPVSHYQVGDKFTLSEEALENYGEHFRGQVFTVEYVADHYVPAKEFFKEGGPRYHESGGHAGFDAETGSCLYDSTFQSALYEWEMEPVEE